MNDYHELTFTINPADEAASDLLACFLADEGFESFVPEGNSLKAYVPAPLYDPARVESVIDTFPMDVSITYSAAFIEGRDWNEEWEKNYFKPIVIGGRVVIHSSFHKDVPAADIDISIDPKMAFGTGHHATTSQVAEMLLDSSLEGKTLIDVGTGTGILAILGCRLGACKVVGVEIDGFAHANACENCRLNGCGSDRMTLIHGDASALSALPHADVLVANINRNIVMRDLPLYAAASKEHARMILSGFYVEDVPVIEEKAHSFGYRISALTHRDNWACVRFER